MPCETEQPVWQISGGRRIVPAPFLIAGIVNVTPDSFSDGGRFFSPDAALERVFQVAREGAHMADLGAESTRPGSADIGHVEEMRRLEPVLVGLRRARDAKGVFFEGHGVRAPSAGNVAPGTGQGAGNVASEAGQSAGSAAPPDCRAGVPLVSIDTWRADTARECLFLGADIINDVAGGCFDPAMAEVVAQFKPGYVLGHSPEKPQTMQESPRYDDVVESLLAFFEERMSYFVKAGLPEECIALDPCIGFGKNLDHNLEIIRAVPRFKTFGRPLYFGISRKSFLGLLTGLGVGERAEATQIATAILAEKGVHIHRVHDVAATVATLGLAAAMAGREASPGCV